MLEKLKGKSVLIVDDDDRNTFALSHYIQTLDMNVSVAQNGQKALDYLRSNQAFDIILLDMMMPVMDGYELLALIRENEVWKQIPIIAVTAKAMKGDKDKCLEAGAWDYIAKPLDPLVLADKMARWV
ncbi:MAG: hybrid sensor histidine kinase/response regulator [Bacteroidota bacterium]|nr:hybrid sensor histidine kinase/response regulator [Bacteroidota bacterium]